MKLMAHAGRRSISGAYRTAVLTSTRPGTPLFVLGRSLPPVPAARSTVITSTRQPACRARSTAISVPARPPTMYTWNQTFGAIAVMASIG